MIERESFEAWARQRWTHPEDFDQRIKAPSKYNNYEVQAAWEAWQERSAQPAPSAPEGWIQRGMAELEAIRSRQDDDTLLDDRTLIERIGKAMLAAAQEAKP